MKKLYNFFTYLTIISFIQFIFWSVLLVIDLVIELDILLWTDFMVILSAPITISSAFTTTSLVKKDEKHIKEPIEKIRESEYCSICSSFLHNDNYPDNFPKKYKICCNCKTIADIVYKENHEKIYNRIIELKELIPNTDAEVYINWSDFYLQNKKKFDDLFIIKNRGTD